MVLFFCQLVYQAFALYTISTMVGFYMQAKLSLLKNFPYEKNKQKNSKLKILFNLIIFVNQIIYQAKAMYQSCKLLSKKTISPFNTTDGKIR